MWMPARDFKAQYADLRMAEAGDPCPRCDGSLRAHRGIEVGHVFFLGTKYTEAMRCTVLDMTGREKPMVMGCYGIGISRVMAAAVEQNHDENGIVWPRQPCALPSGDLAAPDEQARCRRGRRTDLQ